jgi:hypothetical protein
MSTILNYTYSFVATRTGTYWFAACDTPTGTVTPTLQPTYGLYRSSPNGVSCSNYTFVVTSNNTRVAIEQCQVAAPTSSGGIIMPFTHSLVYNAGDIGFICSATAPTLEAGSWADNNTHLQPKSPCDCGRNYLTTTTTTTSTTIVPFTQSWNAERTCGCYGLGSYTISNFRTAIYPNLQGGQYFSTTGPSGNLECYKLLQNVIYRPNYSLFTGTMFTNCSSCDSSLSVPCTTTTTTTTTVFPSVASNCECGTFQCSNYVVEGLVGHAIRWRHCTNNTGRLGFMDFGYYYFYDDETIQFCACSNTVWVVSGKPVINGVEGDVGVVVAAGDACVKKKVGDCTCTAFPVELGVTLDDKSSGRPVLVEYESCYEPDGGLIFPQKTMWPATSGSTFSGLPYPPTFAPYPRTQSGQRLFSRNTHIYSICSCGAEGKLPGDPSYISPTISFWNNGGSTWETSPLVFTQSIAYLGEVEHYIHATCNGGYCSCYQYAQCVTTTTTLIPCPNCRPTVIGATGGNFTNVVYEQCDTLSKHVIGYEYLYTGVTTSICACERCRSVRARPLGAAGTFTPLTYVHCCDPVFSQAGYTPPPYHSSTLNLPVRSCRNYTLNSSGTTVYRYVDCQDSKLKFINIVGNPDTVICAATLSYHSGNSPDIANGLLCGTASAEICISRDYYGPTVFPDDPTLGSVGLGIFTFSNIGSCSCITSDNRYKPYKSRGFLSPISLAPEPEPEFLTITFTTATCSTRTATTPITVLPVPRTPQCCTCRIYSVSLTAGDVITYRPCDANYDPDTFVTLQLPTVTMTGTTQSTGSFSVRVTAAGFYGVGSFSVVFNHNKLVFYTASVLQSSLSTGGAFAVSGSFSRFAWSSVTPLNFGGGDILNFTFAAQSSARMEFVTSSVATFYQSTNVSNSSGVTFSVFIGDGSIKFPGIPLPQSDKGATPPTFPTFP